MRMELINEDDIPKMKYKNNINYFVGEWMKIQPTQSIKIILTEEEDPDKKKSMNLSMGLNVYKKRHGLSNMLVIRQDRTTYLIKTAPQKEE